MKKYSKQQSQTKKFFRSYADEWQSKAADDVYSVINDRHTAVFETLKKIKKGSAVLDVGCGAGHLAIDLDLKGYNAIGVDFADEMIQLANANKKNKKSKANFYNSSIYDFDIPRNISLFTAMGFIEYVSQDELKKILKFFYKNLSDTGYISIGSRNRLFNLCSFNSFTIQEIELNTIQNLLEENIIISNSKSKDQMIMNLRSHENSLSHPEYHPTTKIDVEKRYQYTPSELIKVIEREGFVVENIFPIHFHAFNPNISEIELLNHRKRISGLISDSYQNQFKLIPNSSAFVIEAKKKCSK